jgi:hypothetical protein
MPKVRKMGKVVRVIAHKSVAMDDLDQATKIDVAAIERHLDRAITAAELLDGILDDAIKAASAAT